MNLKSGVATLCIALAAPVFSQSKEADRLASSTAVLKEETSKDLSSAILSQSICVAIFPSVKKVAVGIGGSYGRGVLVCRKQTALSGAWGAPIMFALDQGSLGLQLGSTATDFTLTVMKKEAADRFLGGGAKLGSDAAVAAGPVGSQASAYSPEAQVLTYSRTKGVFAGVSLSGAGLKADDDANKALYGKPITPTEILETQTVPPSAKQLVDLLNRTAPGRPTG